MKMSLNWINDFVDVAEFFAKPAQLGELLTRAGLEVEEITDRRKDYNQVVVGLILEKDKHPGADRLTVCKVTTGEGVIHQIVCGATNHKAGDRVVAALPGAILPGNFAIKKSAIRGVESGGMLCSTTELGLSKASDGIMILPEDAPVGKPFAEYMDLNDVIFELKVTPNRADCLSHFGLAREIACLLDKPLCEPKVERGDSTAKPIDVQVKDVLLCPRYTAAVMENVKVGPSPSWLSKRLETVGINSINNVVDITNYVLMELGQPMHAFDFTALAGKKIVVAKATEGEKFTTLDDREVVMKGDELVIRDGEKIVALAGVMGGKNSGVSESTQTIVLESANFLSSSVRKTSRRFGIESDSSYRFSRGVDFNIAHMALDRARGLVSEICGGKSVEGTYDSQAEPKVREEIAIDLSYVTDRLGYPAEVTKFENFMTRLGCGLKKSAEGAYKIQPPSFRFDIERDVDLVEEYARLNGYDQIPEVLPPAMQAPLAHDAVYERSELVHSVFQKAGFTQALNQGFTSSKSENEFLGPREALRGSGLSVPEVSVPIKNPLSDDLNVMRSSLAEGLFTNAWNNVRHGNDWGALYEVGGIFAAKDAGYQESLRLGLVKWGQPRSLFTKSQQQPVVYDLKAAVETMLAGFRIRNYTWVVPKNKGDIPKFCHRNQFAHLNVEGKVLGFIATVHPLVLEERKIRVPMAIAEFNIEVLLKMPARPYKAEALSRMPSVERDLALVMAKSQSVGELIKDMGKEAGALLQEIDVFDVFTGDSVGADKKSVTFRFVFQDRNTTLQEAQVQDLMNRITAKVTQSFNVGIR